LKPVNFEDASEETIVAEVKNGNREAWSHVIKLYYKPLYMFILSMVKETNISEELVQDVFVNFWVKREKITITSSLKAYLYRASRNHTLNYLKRRKFELDYQKGLAQTTKNYQTDTEDRVHYDELERHLYGAIDDLPDKCREIFKMSRFEELTYKEISDALGIPVRTVHYQIGLALKELRTKLKSLYNKEIIPLIPLLVGLWDVLFH